MEWPEEAQLCVINAADVAEPMLSLPLIRWARVDKKNFFFHIASAQHHLAKSLDRDPAFRIRYFRAFAEHSGLLLADELTLAHITAMHRLPLCETIAKLINKSFSLEITDQSLGIALSALPKVVFWNINYWRTWKSSEQGKKKQMLSGPGSPKVSS